MSISTAVDTNSQTAWNIAERAAPVVIACANATVAVTIVAAFTVTACAYITSVADTDFRE